MASNPLSYFMDTACYKDFDVFMRYSELYVSYRKYLKINKKRSIGYKEFNDVLANEGLEIQKTTKKVGDNFINGKFIFGVKLKKDWEMLIMPVMPVMLFNSLSSLYKGTKGDSLHNGHNEHNTPNQSAKMVENAPKVQEELIEDLIYLPCDVCGSTPSNHYDNHGKPICNACSKAKEANR